MQFSIKGSKSDDGATDMCRSCASAHIFTDAAGEHKMCSETGNTIPVRGQVTQCNDYSLAGHNEYQFEKIAWIIETKNGKPVGFRPPKKEKDD